MVVLKKIRVNLKKIISSLLPVSHTEESVFQIFNFEYLNEFLKRNQNQPKVPFSGLTGGFWWKKFRSNISWDCPFQVNLIWWETPFKCEFTWAPQNTEAGSCGGRAAAQSPQYSQHYPACSNTAHITLHAAIQPTLPCMQQYSYMLTFHNHCGNSRNNETPP